MHKSEIEQFLPSAEVPNFETWMNSWPGMKTFWMKKSFWILTSALFTSKQMKQDFASLRLRQKFHKIEKNSNVKNIAETLPNWIYLWRSSEHWQIVNVIKLFCRKSTFPQNSEIEKLVMMSEPAQKFENNDAIFKQNCTQRLFIGFKMAYSCRFS